MMPDIEREERRKKRAPVIAFILFGMLVVAALVQPGWQWVPLAVGAVAITAVGVGIDLPGRPSRGSRRGNGFSGCGWDDDDRAVGATTRSYLLSAPRLAVMMWAREVQRRAQPGPRRPG
jgi:hypothetical protein